jgi:hypothetical protein
MTFVLAVRADDKKPAPKGKDLNKEATDVRDVTALKERILAKRFNQFKADLLRVKQRLDKGSAEDKAKAKALDNALKHIDDNNIDTKFSQLIEILKTKSLTNPNNVQEAMDQSLKVAEEIRTLLKILREDNRAAQLRDERKRLEEMIRELEGIIRDQKNARAKTAQAKMDKGDLKKTQENVTNRTDDLRVKLGGKKSGDQAGKGQKDTRGEAKGKGKGAGKDGEGKGKDKGKGEGEGKGKEGKKGDGNGGKGGDKKAGDAKGKGQGGEGKKAGSKGSKPGEGSKGAGSKGSKPGEGKPGAGKGKGKGEGESKGGGKGGEGGEGKKGESKGGGKGGKGGKSGSKGGGQPGQPGGDNNNNNNQQQPPSDTADARKKIQDAEQMQKKAEDQLEQDRKKEAEKNQADAAKKLEEAKKKLEELLRQAREEELERLLNALENRCRQMLEMQRKVKIGTVRVDKDIKRNKDKKPTRANHQDSGRLAEEEKLIVIEATKAIEMIEAEGSAVAFAEVFKQVRTDMEEVQKELEKTRVGEPTQQIEQEIIEMLEDMIKALQKAQKEPKPSKPGQSQGGQPPDQKLLDQIAELKIIRAMQLKVNQRTKMYGNMHKKEGEQTANTEIKGKLKDLSERQENLHTVTMKIVKGDNK